MTNFERYNALHNEVMKRLEEGEITTESAKELNDRFFDRYVVEFVEGRKDDESQREYRDRVKMDKMKDLKEIISKFIRSDEYKRVYKHAKDASYYSSRLANPCKESLEELEDLQNTLSSYNGLSIDTYKNYESKAKSLINKITQLATLADDDLVKCKNGYYQKNDNNKDAEVSKKAIEKRLNA